MGFGVEGVGFEGRGFRRRFQDLRSRVNGGGFRVQGLGVWVEESGWRV